MSDDKKDEKKDPDLNDVMRNKGARPPKKNAFLGLLLSAGLALIPSSVLAQARQQSVSIYTKTEVAISQEVAGKVVELVPAGEYVTVISEHYDGATLDHVQIAYGHIVLTVSPGVLDYYD